MLTFLNLCDASNAQTKLGIKQMGSSIVSYCFLELGTYMFEMAKQKLNHICHIRWTNTMNDDLYNAPPTMDSVSAMPTFLEIY